MRLHLSSLILLAALGSIAPAAQTPADSAHATVTVRLPTGKATYRIGEEIPLELEFRGTAGNDYYFSTETYDSSGRMTTERYEMTPPGGFVDPLSDLFVDGSFVGGLRTTHPLDGTPFTLHVSLNDWVQFKRPGRYRLSVTSSRLHRRSSQPAPALTNSSVTLTIMPRDSRWESEQIRAVTDLIDRGTDVEHDAALLRYLATEPAAETLVARDDAIAAASGWEFEAALISSPYRALIVRQMEAKVDAGANLDAEFLPTLTRLRVLLDVPPAPGNATQRRERMPGVRTEYEVRWRAALARRPMTAGVLGAELMQLQTNATDELKSSVARDLEQHPAEAAAALVALRPEKQEGLLGSDTGWAYVNHGWVRPVLRRLYADWHASGRQNDFPGLGDVVLKRLYELDSEEGRRLILDEIRSGAHGIRYEALAILTDATLPELDAPLQARFLSPNSTDAPTRDEDQGTAAWLMARYGSDALLPFVADQLARFSHVCVLEGGLDAYLFKHDPSAAAARVDLTRAADRSGCDDPLDAVATHLWSDRVEAAAIAQLTGADARQAADAAQLLGAHGSTASKQPLVDRLTAWSAEWRGRAPDIAAMRPDLASPGRVENSIVNALFENKRFALTSDDVAKIRALCVTDQCPTNVDARVRSRQFQ